MVNWGGAVTFVAPVLILLMKKVSKGVEVPLEEPDCLSSVRMSEEKVLLHHLLRNYSLIGKNGRPVLNISTTIAVDFGLGLIQMDLDEKYKVLKMSMWTRYRWRDEYLRWRPDDYAGLRAVRMNSKFIWIPDVMLYNTADTDGKARDVLAVVKYDGTVLWVPHQMFKSSCSLDVTNFPFDHQSCHMWFGSWTHTRQEIDLNMAFEGGIDLSTFQSDHKESSDWDIYSSEANKKILPNENDSQSYAVLTFQLKMKRKLVFSSYILTLPCVFLACLTLVVFWLPPDRPDRTALAMSIFASFLVLLLILVEAAPPTASSVPVLGVYYCFNMVIIMLSVFLSSLVVNVCRAGDGTQPAPRWLKLITLGFMKHIDQIRKRLTGKFKKSQDTVLQNGGPFSSSHACAAASETTERHKRAFYQEYSRDTGTVDSHLFVQGDLTELKQSLMQIKSNLSERNDYDNEQAEIAREWRGIALCMDRFFFLLYIILIISSLVTLFPRPS